MQNAFGFGVDAFATGKSDMFDDGPYSGAASAQSTPQKVRRSHTVPTSAGLLYLRYHKMWHSLCCGSKPFAARQVDQTSHVRTDQPCSSGGQRIPQGFYAPGGQENHAFSSWAPAPGQV